MCNGTVLNEFFVVDHRRQLSLGSGSRRYGHDYFILMLIEIDMKCERCR